MKFCAKYLAPICFVGLASVCCAQSAPATQAPDQQKPPDAATPTPAPAPAAPAPLPTPAITGPLQGQPPFLFDAGPFGKIAVNGILSGSGLWQSNHVPGDNPTQAALSNGQIFIQKTDGWFQFYLQAGAYTIPALGTPFLSTNKTLSDFYGPLPQAFLKLQAGKDTSFEIGALPTLFDGEYTFSFENMNIERGLLWNQENAVNRGIQVNQTLGKFTAALSWNDGYYSNRYTWLSGSLAYTTGPHTLAFVGMGNLGQTKFQTLATPVQNNSVMYNVIYTYTKGPWIVQPYFQYTDVPTNATIGVVKGASTKGAAVLVSRAFKRGFSLAGARRIYLKLGERRQPGCQPDLRSRQRRLVGHFDATFQYGGFFVRGDLSSVWATWYTPGFAFGSTRSNSEQPRAMAEIGFIVGNNITEKKP